MIKNQYSLPKIDNLFGHMKGKTMFSEIDLRPGLKRNISIIPHLKRDLYSMIFCFTIWINKFPWRIYEFNEWGIL